MGDIRVTSTYEQHSTTSYGILRCCTVSSSWVAVHSGTTRDQINDAPAPIDYLSGIMT